MVRFTDPRLIERVESMHRGAEAKAGYDRNIIRRYA